MTWGRLGSVAVATVAVLVVTLTVDVDAGAARLSSAEPADGATVATAPDRVSLTFSASVDPALSHLTVVRPDGAAVGRGRPVVRGATMVLPVSIGGGGTYEAVYHAVLGDGREVSGTTRFSVGTATAGAPAVVSDGGSDGHEHGVDPLSLAVIGLDTVLAVFVLVLLFRRRVPASGEPATRT